MNDIISLAASFALVALAAGASYALHRSAAVPAALSRKACHVIVSFWVFIMVYGFSSTWARLIGPAVFIVANFLISRSGLGSAIGLGERRLDPGLVTYPFSLLVLSLLYSLGIICSGTAIASVMIMGIGDGAAAIAGRLCGKERKSLAGSIAMAVVSFFVILLSMDTLLSFAFIAAMTVSLVEHITPPGYDNLTVPLASAGLLEAICSL